MATGAIRTDVQETTNDVQTQAIPINLTKQISMIKTPRKEIGFERDELLHKEFPFPDAGDLLFPLSSSTDINTLRTLVCSLRVKLEKANFQAREQSKHILSMGSQQGEFLIENQELKNALQQAEQHTAFTQQRLRNLNLDALRGQALSDCSQELAHIRLMCAQKQKQIMELKQKLRVAQISQTSDYYGLQQECVRLIQERNQSQILLQAGNRELKSNLEIEKTGGLKKIQEITSLQTILQERDECIRRLSTSITEMGSLQNRTLNKCKELTKSLENAEHLIATTKAATLQKSMELETSKEMMEELQAEISCLKNNDVSVLQERHQKEIQVLSEKNKKELQKLRQQLNKGHQTQLDTEKKKQFELSEKLKYLKESEWNQTQLSSPNFLQHLVKDYKSQCNGLVEQLGELAEGHQKLQQTVEEVQQELEEKDGELSYSKMKIVSLRCKNVKLQEENEDLTLKLDQIKSHQMPCIPSMHSRSGRVLVTSSTMATQTTSLLDSMSDEKIGCSDQGTQTAPQLRDGDKSHPTDSSEELQELTEANKRNLPVKYVADAECLSPAQVRLFQRFLLSHSQLKPQTPLNR